MEGLIQSLAICTVEYIIAPQPGDEGAVLYAVYFLIDGIPFFQLLADGIYFPEELSLYVPGKAAEGIPVIGRLGPGQEQPGKKKEARECGYKIRPDDLAYVQPRYRLAGAQNEDLQDRQTNDQQEDDDPGRDKKLERDILIAADYNRRC